LSTNSLIVFLSVFPSTDLIKYFNLVELSRLIASVSSLNTFLIASTSTSMSISSLCVGIEKVKTLSVFGRVNENELIPFSYFEKS
jgi:hypothetical protein